MPITTSYLCLPGLPVLEQRTTLRIEWFTYDQWYDHSVWWKPWTWGDWGLETKASEKLVQVPGWWPVRGKLW